MDNIAPWACRQNRNLYSGPRHQIQMWLTSNSFWNHIKSQNDVGREKRLDDLPLGCFCSLSVPHQGQADNHCLYSGKLVETQETPIRLISLSKQGNGLWACHLYRCTGIHTQKGPALCLMLRCCDCEILNNFWTRGPAFSFFTAYHCKT